MPDKKTITIFRTNKQQHHYVIMDKRFLDQQPDLSWKAKGILSYLLAKPDDWEVNKADIIKRAKDQRDAVSSGLEELETAGYLVRTVERNPDGTFRRHVYNVFEVPAKEYNTQPLTDNPEVDHPLTGFPEVDNPEVVYPEVDNPPQLNNKDTNNPINKQTKGNNNNTDAGPDVVIIPPAEKKQIQEMLEKIGWVGNQSEVWETYQENSKYVNAWLAVTLKADMPQSYKAGWFRKQLRSGSFPKIKSGANGKPDYVADLQAHGVEVPA